MDFPHLLSPLAIISLVPLILFIGALIGATGIGGVLLVPALSVVAAVPLEIAIASSSLAFALPGLVALRALSGMARDVRGLTGFLVIACIGAAIGAWSLSWVPGTWLMSGVTALVLFAGARGLWRPAAAAVSPVPLPRTLTWLVGFGVGLGSALTGTGGPVLLLPVLLLLRQAVMFSVVTAQAIQLPVALASGAVHALHGRLDVLLALLCGLLMSAGAVLGQRWGRRLQPRRLQQIVAVLLLGVGAWLLALQLCVR